MKKFRLSPRFLMKAYSALRATIQDVNSALAASSDGGSRLTHAELTVIAWSAGDCIAELIFVELDSEDAEPNAA